MKPAFRTTTAALILAAAAIGLAGCAKQEPANEEYKTDVVDKSGGELIVTDPTPEPQGVKLPETPMTPVPDEKAGE